VGGLMIRLENEAKEGRKIREMRQKVKKEEKEGKRQANGGYIRIHSPRCVPDQRKRTSFRVSCWMNLVRDRA
jgi:hypothetical protein